MDTKTVLQLTYQSLAEKCETSAEGLSASEAAKRLALYGKNSIGKKQAHALRVFVRQFESSLIYLLAAAAGLSYWINDYTDGTVIMIILIINTSLGFYQEYKSERIIEKLTLYITKEARLKRDGQYLLADTTEIVPGDVLSVHEGDRAPADMVLFETSGLEINESELTGESVPIAKSAAGNAKITAKNIVFTGSVIERGEGTGIVYATGTRTEFGEIAALSSATKKETPYEKSLRSFSSYLIQAALIGLTIIFMLKLAMGGGLSTMTELVLFMIATAIAIVPEVMPVIATVSLSSGSLKLAKKHVIVRRLSAIEDLGNVTVLCTDKTGTITENRMTVTTLVSDDSRLFQKFAIAAIAPLKNKKRKTHNTYDDAFLAYVGEAIQKEASHLHIIKELPFDPEARRRRVVLEDARHKHFLVAIGAPEVLLKIAHTPHHAAYLHDITREGRAGLHHLGIAYTEVSYSDDFDILKHESHLTFLGYVGLSDPLRPTAKSTIHHAEKLGIEIKVLTGDSKEVAEYVGRQIGLVQEGSSVYTGDELDAMSAGEFKAAVIGNNIFARISPTQKFNIIKILKESSYTVAYQGDGINDAPALKLADVAIAVNTATDIAKENADIVLLNKNLEVVINGIRYGRSIFVNINKYIKYTMVNNIGNGIALSILYLFSTDLPMLPIQILLTSMITDIPLITISSDTVEDEEVVRPERHNIRDIMALPLVLGVPTALFELGYFFLIRSQPLAFIQTEMYAFFTAITLIVFFVVRNRSNFWRAGAPSPVLIVSFLAATLCSFALIYIPASEQWFSFVPLPGAALFLVVMLALAYFLICDFIKVAWYAPQTRLVSKNPAI